MCFVFWLWRVVPVATEAVIVTTMSTALEMYEGQCVSYWIVLHWNCYQSSKFSSIL